MNLRVNLRIVVADDERDMRDYLVRILPLLGHEVVGVAATGQELVDACAKTSPDLVITDIKMPGLDGLAAIDRIDSLPVVVVSGHAETERKGVHAYLIKPIKRRHIEQAISDALAAFGEG